MERYSITQEELKNSFAQLNDMSLDRVRNLLNEAGCWSQGDYVNSNRKTALYDMLVVFRRKATDEAMRREVVKRELSKKH